MSVNGRWETARCAQRAIWIASLWGLVIGGQRLAAQLPPAEAETLIGRYVAAGEFAPALAAAGRLSDPGVRDAQLARIAAAQAGLGAREASMRTLASMQDDRRRSQALRSLGSGARGGGAIADFDTLINLITSTIAPDSWTDTGGNGAIEPFPTGVYVDARGVMRLVRPEETNPLLDDVHHAARLDSGNRAVARTTTLRKVSLNRLERALQIRRAFGQPPDDAMLPLAGLYRLRYVLVYPDTGDLVLAGPAGDWRRDPEGRQVNVDTGQPVLQLDDLIVILRNAYDHHGRFGCAIQPRQENLAGVKTFVERWRGKAVNADKRAQWLCELRAVLGQQDVDVWGLDSRTHAARVLVEADYRMKLVGMGLESGTLGVRSYLDLAAQAGDETPQSMNVLRWWFTLNYKGLRATPDQHVFALEGQGVQVLSENEWLTETGKQVHLGTADELNREFAHSFTRQFDVLAAKYPVYAELRNVFDLAIVSALISERDLAGQVGWHLTHFRDAQACPVKLGAVPEQVDSVVNAVTVNRRRFLAGVSGGVSADAGGFVRTASVTVDDYGRLDAEHAAAQPEELPPEVWWWD